MRAPISLDKHVGQREPRVSDKNEDIRPDPYAGEPGSVNASGFNPLFSESSMQAQVQPELNFGKFPLPQNMQFAGVSNGESLWAFPKSQSPEAMSDVSGQPEQPRGIPLDIPRQDDPMADIDWEAFDALFPPAQQAELSNTPSFPFPGVPGQY